MWSKAREGAKATSLTFVLLDFQHAGCQKKSVYIYSDAVCRDRPEVSVAADEMLHTTTEVYTFFPCLSTGERVLFSLSLSPPVAADEMLHATTEVSVAASRKAGIASNSRGVTSAARSINSNKRRGQCCDHFRGVLVNQRHVPARAARTA